jgi:hypothetical protein
LEEAFGNEFNQLHYKQIPQENFEEKEVRLFVAK